MSDSTTIGKHERETVDPIYGWRYYLLADCKAHNVPALIGSYGTVVHSSLSPEAICRESNYGHKCSLEAIEPSCNHFSPDPDCTCGYYLSFAPRWPEYPSYVAIWCQAIGPTQIHALGCRTRQVRMIAAFFPKFMDTYPFDKDGFANSVTTKAMDFFKNLGVPAATYHQASDLLYALDIPWKLDEVYPQWIYYDDEIWC